MAIGFGAVGCLIYYFSLLTLDNRDPRVKWVWRALGAGCAFGLCASTWNAIRYRRTSGDLSPVLTFSSESFRDSRLPGGEVGWEDVRGMRLQVESSVVARAVIEVEIGSGVSHSSMFVDVLNLERTPDEIIRLMEGYCARRRLLMNFVELMSDWEAMERRILAKTREQIDEILRSAGFVTSNAAPTASESDRGQPETEGPHPNASDSGSNPPMEERVLCSVCGFRYLRALGWCVKCAFRKVRSQPPTRCSGSVLG
jgi:hypothetical protein